MPSLEEGLNLTEEQKDKILKFAVHCISNTLDISESVTFAVEHRTYEKFTEQEKMVVGILFGITYAEQNSKKEI